MRDEESPHFKGCLPESPARSLTKCLILQIRIALGGCYCFTDLSSSYFVLVCWSQQAGTELWLDQPSSTAD